MSQLTTHFTYEEFKISGVDTRRGINNDPQFNDDAPHYNKILDRLINTADNMEVVRRLLNVPIIIDSGYRCELLNKAVGGALHSAHLTGDACDFIAPKYGTPDAIYYLLKHSEIINYDQLIREGDWVHLSFDERLRRQNLIATFNNGIATYKEDI